MRRIWWLIVIVVSMGVGQPTAVGTDTWGDADEIEQLVLAPSVADNVALLFTEFQRELVLCLEGERHGNTLYINDFRMPHILVSETGRVQAAGCRRGAETVGTWHNHPAPSFKLAAANPESLSRNCYLSRTDIRDFSRRKDALVSVVSCGPGTFAYWWRRDIGSSDLDVALLPPPEGQLVRAEASTNRGGGSLTQARSR